jgi:hypothetical protein
MTFALNSADPHAPAYRLTAEVDHFGRFDLDWNYDLEMVPWAGVEAHTVLSVEDVADRGLILFQGYPDVVRHIDFPYAFPTQWPIMSRRMYDVLFSVGAFARELLPFAVVDGTRAREAWFDSGRLRPECVVGDFVLPRLSEPLDIFDAERSKYAPYTDAPGFLGSVDEYVLKLPREGLPPLFMLKGEPHRLFVSNAARRALMAAKIQGPAYVSLRGYGAHGSLSDEVDVPVAIPGLAPSAGPPEREARAGEKPRSRPSLLSRLRSIFR